MRIVAAVVLTALSLTLGGPPVPAGAAEPSCRPGAPTPGDYDGDRVPDPAIRADRESGPAYWVELSGSGEDRWLPAATVANFDFNGDTCSDAVITDGIALVQVIPGSATGLVLDAALEVPIPQQANLAAGERLRLAAIGLRHHGFVQVVVAGAKVTAVGAETGPFVNVSWRQPSGEFGAPQVYDGVLFRGADAATFAAGPSLAGSGGTFLVGSAGATVGGHRAAGAVYLFYPDGDDHTGIMLERLTQNEPGFPGTAEKGDRFGASVAVRDGWLAIGVPGESIGNDSRTGMVHPIAFNADSSYMRVRRSVHQDIAGMPGTNEDGDGFGREVLIARGLTGTGSYDLVISSNEGIGRHPGAGAVTIAHVTKATSEPSTRTRPASPGPPEAATSSARLGSCGHPTASTRC